METSRPELIAFLTAGAFEFVVDVKEAVLVLAASSDTECRLSVGT